MRDSLQDIRFKLQKRYTRLQSSEPFTFAIELISFWDFFDSTPELTSVANELMSNHPNIRFEIDAAVRGQLLHGLTESERAAIGYEIARRVATTENQGLAFHQYSHGSLQSALDSFRSTYIDLLYEYIDEHLQESNLVLAHIIRFKHLAEWFRREELWNQYSSAVRSGERVLAYRLYEYLYDHGVEFAIEPTSASGEIDMISSQSGNDRLLADVKIYSPSSGRGGTYIEKGLSQVYRYLQDFNKSVGYLVVFKTEGKEISLQGAEGDIPRFLVCNKTIFIIEIDVFPHEMSASKRGIVEPETITFKEPPSATQ